MLSHVPQIVGVGLVPVHHTSKLATTNLFLGRLETRRAELQHYIKVVDYFLELNALPNVDMW